MGRWMVAVGLATVMGVLTVGAEGPQMLAARVSWPGIETVWQYHGMYLSSAPTDVGLKHAKAQGVKTVVNLMEASEQPTWPRLQPKPWTQYLLEYFFPRLKPWNEAEAARALGLRYEHIPLSVDHPSDAQVERFLAIVKEVNEQQLLVHCDAAGRALAVWAIYLGTAKGYTPEQALAQAEQAGLTHEGLKRFVLDYLKRHGSPGELPA